VPDAKLVRRLTFQEAAELAYFGAKVLHPATIRPAVSRGIPVLVLNSMRPQKEGTRIVASCGEVPKSGLVKSIAYKENLAVVSIRSSRMLMAYGFLARIFEVFNRYETAVDLVSTSEVSVSATVDNMERLEEIKEALLEYGEVDIRHGQAIVCLVGEDIGRVPGMAARIFAELEDVEVRLISQGASEINISFVIDAQELPRVVRRLHKKFFSGPLDPELFSV
jgi:aspartate kinase